ncbi:MAG: PD-(D/E)XK nuclease family protein [Candidatus Bathyarchaeia archaeon]
MPHKEISGIPSVTQILEVISKPWLVRWYAVNGLDFCTKIRKESQEVGTRLHEVVYKFLQDGSEEGLSSYEKLLATEVKGWFVTNNLTILEMEPDTPYVSKRYGYQGTFDCIARDKKGRLYVIDFKATSTVSKLNALQLSAYGWLYLENKCDKKWKPIRGIIIQFRPASSKDSLIKVYKFYRMRWYFSIFRKVLHVYKFVTDYCGISYVNIL